MTDIPALLDSPTTFPFLQLFYNVTRSNAATAIMAAIIIITLVMAVVSEVATASRQIWAFSRDNGFPLSAFLRRVRFTSPLIPFKIYPLHPLHLRHNQPHHH